MRSSLRFYSELLRYSSQNLNPPSFSTDGIVRLCFPSHSLHLHSSSSLPNSNSSLDSLKLGLAKSEGVPAVSASSSSTGAVDLTSFVSASASKAREIVDLTRHYSRCYWELSKACLSMLVVATSGTGFVLGSSNAVDFPALCWTCMGTMMVAASANSLNQFLFYTLYYSPSNSNGIVNGLAMCFFFTNLPFSVFEINNDAKMKRTSKRPLPSGRITLPHTVNWSSSVGLAGTALIAAKANTLAAGLAASNLVLYAFVYTPLKQTHPVNTWVGAVVGAVPPLLGWAAAAGDISLNALILPAALYFWQLPHFMALAHMCRSDYAAGGYVQT